MDKGCALRGSEGSLGRLLPGPGWVPGEDACLVRQGGSQGARPREERPLWRPRESRRWGNRWRPSLLLPLDLRSSGLPRATLNWRPRAQEPKGRSPVGQAVGAGRQQEDGAEEAGPPGGGAGCAFHASTAELLLHVPFAHAPVKFPSCPLLFCWQRV